MQPNRFGVPKTELVGESFSHRFRTAQTRLLNEHETRVMARGSVAAEIREAAGAPLLGGEANQYEYLGEIARGGMGRIVSVRDRWLRRQVAMKILASANGKSTRNQIDRLLTEAQTTGQLEHPNIVPIHDAGIYENDKYYFTMKHVKGVTLKHIFRKLSQEDSQTSEQYSLVRLLGIFQQIANGLAFAHSRGVVHRDLKPDNIMIGQFGEVLIMDWGIAKLLSSRTPATSSPGVQNGDQEFADSGRIDTPEHEATVVGTITGTVGYMSPEQARGEVDKLDARTDIFSLGAMLYEMLAGSPPYDHPTADERLLAAANEEGVERPGVRLRRTNQKRTTRIPREVSAIAMKAIAHQPADRYQSAQDFFDDIQRYLEGHSVSACRDTLVQQATKWLKRNRVMAGSIAAVVGAVLVAVLGARFMIHRSVLKKNMNEGQRIVDAAHAQRDKEVLLISQSKVPDDPYADLNTQRALDSIDERYSTQMVQAAEYYSRVFDYDASNAQARAKLAGIDMELWRVAQRRNKQELMTAYAREVARYAGPDYGPVYKSEIDGDGKFVLQTADVRAEVFIFRYVETGKWNRLTPIPYRLSERKVDEAALHEAASRLRLAADGRDAGSLYFLNLDANYGQDLGQTPLTLERMPVGSYLLVLRAPGYEDLHLPVTLARQKNLELNVKLLKTGERPADFAYVPAVLAKVGGPAAGTKWPNYTWKAVAPYFIQTYEVTFGEYEVFLNDLISQGRVGEAIQHLPRDFGFNYLQIIGSEIKPHSKLTSGWRKWPVRGVSWLDAKAFADWRSRKEGVAYRLPTELEWEVAARGTDGRRYTWGENFWPLAARLSQGYGGLSNLEADSLRRNGQFADESVFGVWDMTGSQAEWCADEFSGREGERVLRGNAWALQPVGLETAFRTSGPPDYFHSTTGFRLARDLR